MLRFTDPKQGGVDSETLTLALALTLAVALAQTKQNEVKMKSGDLGQAGLGKGVWLANLPPGFLW